MKKQITKAQALELALVVVDKAIEDKTFYNTDLFDEVDVELLDKLQAMLEQEIKISSRKRGESKTTKAKKEDIEILQDWFMAEADPESFYTAKDLILAIEEFKDYSSQKMTARLSQMVKDEQLVKGDKAKRVAYKVI